VRMMTIGLPATDWVPPLLRYYDRFGTDRLTEFLRSLDNKFSADWLAGQTPTDRIAAMNGIIHRIDDASTVGDVFTADGFSFDTNAFLRTLDGPVYGRRFAKYVVMKLDYLYKNHAQRMHFETVSVEHILPQNPADDSQWVQDFTLEQREEWTNRIGNLVIITRRKNSSQGRLDFAKKVQKYFHRNIDTCPNSIRVLEKYDRWTPVGLAENHETLVMQMKDHYNVNGT